MLQLQQEFRQCVAHGEALNQRVNVMEAEAAVLRSAAADAEAAREADAAELAAGFAAAAPRPELRSIGVQAGLPAGLVTHSPRCSREEPTGSCSELLCMSAYTQTDAQQPAKCEAAGTQTDDESLKDERLKMWEQSKQHRTVTANRTGRAGISCELGEGGDVGCAAESHSSAHGRPAQEYNNPMPRQVVSSEASSCRRDLYEDGSWVHGRNGCAAFVGDTTAPCKVADVASSWAHRSPPAAMKGPRTPHTDRYATVGANSSSAPTSRAGTRQEQHAVRSSRYSACSSMDTEGQHGHPAWEHRAAAHEEPPWHEEDTDFEFRAAPNVHQRHSAGLNSKGRSVSVPPTSRAGHGAGDAKGLYREHGSGECDAPHGGEQRRAGLPAGGREPKRRDRSVPARRQQKEVQYDGIDAKHQGERSSAGVGVLSSRFYAPACCWQVVIANDAIELLASSVCHLVFAFFLSSRVSVLL